MHTWSFAVFARKLFLQALRQKAQAPMVVADKT
jgi:hypothetical protein